jgi:hypothetical protein
MKKEPHNISTSSRHIGALGKRLSQEKPRETVPGLKKNPMKRVEIKI